MIFDSRIDPDDEQPIVINGDQEFRTYRELFRLAIRHDADYDGPDPDDDNVLKSDFQSLYEYLCEEDAL